MTLSALMPDGFAVVQPGLASGGQATYIPAGPDTVLWGRLPMRGERPVATVGPGDTVVLDTVSHEGILEDQGSDPVAYFGRHGVPRDSILSDAVEICTRLTRNPATDGPHIITGPVAVAGAVPGDLLAVRIDRLQMRAPYGVISTRHGRGVRTGRPDVDGAYGGFCRVVDEGGSWYGSIPLHRNGSEQARFPLSPFLGTIGVATDTAERANSTPPGPHGGNIDIKLLTPGATLFLPVQAPGALLYVGDPHFAQGNGEVALTAFEAPLRAWLTVDVVPAALAAELSAVRGPFATAGGFVIPTGLDADLNRGLELCVANAVELLHALFEMEPRQAYLYLSAATDFTISQAVDLVSGVHGQIRTADFARSRDSELARRILGPR
ncbi:acetamidase/formamidase family protein [Nocardia sp. BMG51109]|uniref:acetamidase/formamidase family protein n=1 Tax=Nocardia sp. BMG51109 TaxID=1056816 RepID=UPI0004AC6157|nr:acetamidase/formamidase family protein [Nocardia sp. BMG51109]